MKPYAHFIVSAFIGATVWFFMKSLYTAFVCFFAGILSDIDHFIEFIIHYGWKEFTFKKLCLACEQTARQEGEYYFRRLYIIFHSAEIVFLLWLLTLYTKNLYLLAGALGYSAHLLLDYIGNPFYFHTYIVVCRIMNKFNSSKMVRREFIQKKNGSTIE